MATWKEPKNDYTAGSQVTPAIFNNLAENERYLKHTQDTKIATEDVQNASIGSKVFATRTNILDAEQLKIGFGKIRKWFSDLRGLAFKDTITEVDISGTISGNKISGAVALSDKASQLSNSRSIGLSGLSATPQEFNGTANVSIPVTAIPGTLLTGSTAINTSGNAGSATKLQNARTIGVSGATGAAQSFNGTANITIPISAVPTAIITGNLDSTRINGLATVAKTGSYNDLTNKPPSAGKQVIWSSGSATISVPINKSVYEANATYEFLCRDGSDLFVFYQKYTGDDRFIGLNVNSTGYMTDGVVNSYYLTIDLYTNTTYMYGSNIYHEGDYVEYRQKSYPCYEVNKLL